MYNVIILLLHVKIYSIFYRQYTTQKPAPLELAFFVILDFDFVLYPDNEYLFHIYQGHTGLLSAYRH